MFDRDVVLEALSELLNASVTSPQSSQRGSAISPSTDSEVKAEQLSINDFIPTVLDAAETSEVSKTHFTHIKSICEGDQPAARVPLKDTRSIRNLIINEDEFFDPQFDYDLTNLKDTESYYRGGEVYERPCGWQRFALKVLDKYDGNTWLGNRYRSTQSVPGEWPVSYHGTSKEGAAGIIKGFYKPGPREKYGRGVYSTPFIAEAIGYTKTFIHNGQSYKVILQNRVNPQYRKKHYNNKYWLIPINATTSPEKEKEFVERAIRPYGLLMKKV